MYADILGAFFTFVSRVLFVSSSGVESMSFLNSLLMQTALMWLDWTLSVICCYTFLYSHFDCEIIHIKYEVLLYAVELLLSDHPKCWANIVLKWGGLWSRLHLHGTMNGNISERVVLKEGWSVIRASCTWKHERKDYWKSCLKRGVVCDQGFMYMKAWMERLLKELS